MKDLFSEKSRRRVKDPLDEKFKAVCDLPNSLWDTEGTLSIVFTQRSKYAAYHAAYFANDNPAIRHLQQLKFASKG